MLDATQWNADDHRFIPDKGVLYRPASEINHIQFFCGGGPMRPALLQQQQCSFLVYLRDSEQKNPTFSEELMEEMT